MTSATAGSAPGTVCADVMFPLVLVRGGEVPDGAAGGRLTTSGVAALLGMHRSRVLEIPREHLPYETTPGGPERGGRRSYDPEHVETYRKWRAGTGPSVPELERTIADLGCRIAALEEWRSQVEGERPPAE